MRTWLRCMVLVGLAWGLLTGGCTSLPQPFEYQKANELKPGPGIFTGEKGVYTIYDPPSTPVGEKKEASEKNDSYPPDSLGRSED